MSEDSIHALQDEELEVFALSTKRYFERAVGATTTLQDAQIKFSVPELSDFSGLIHMSGAQRGLVCVTMSEDGLQQLLARLGEPNQDAEMCRDLVGEIASTIASNAREHFGSKVGISTPVAIGRLEAAAVPWPFSHFSIPFTVLGSESQLVISLEGN